MEAAAPSELGLQSSHFSFRGGIAGPASTPTKAGGRRGPVCSAPGWGSRKQNFKAVSPFVTPSQPHPHTPGCIPEPEGILPWEKSA